MIEESLLCLFHLITKGSGDKISSIQLGFSLPISANQYHSTVPTVHCSTVPTVYVGKFIMLRSPRESMIPK